MLMALTIHIIEYERFTRGSPQQNWALFQVCVFSRLARDMFWKSYDFQAYFFSIHVP